MSTDKEPFINFELLHDLRTKPHPHPELPNGADFLLTEEAVAQHLLDIAGVPYEPGYRGNLGARTYLLLTEVLALRERLARISSWHSRESGQGGLVGTYCTECGQLHPCDTKRMATGTYQDAT